MKTVAPVIALLSENERTSSSQTACRSAGSRAASGVAASPSLRAIARATRSTGIASPRSTTTTSVASTYGIGRPRSDSGTTATIGTPARLAARRSRSSGSPGSPASR